MSTPNVAKKYSIGFNAKSMNCIDPRGDDMLIELELTEWQAEVLVGEIAAKFGDEKIREWREAVA